MKMLIPSAIAPTAIAAMFGYMTACGNEKIAASTPYWDSGWPKSGAN